MKKSTLDAIFSFARLRRQHISRVSVLALSLAIIPATAFCAPQVSGSLDSVSINTDNSSIKDVLAALGQKFNLQIQSSADLSKQITGTYRGSLRRVVSRLLEDYSFILMTNGNRIEITVVGPQSGSAAASQTIVATASPAAGTAVPAANVPPQNVTSNPPPVAQPQPVAAVAQQSRPAVDNAVAMPQPTPAFRVAEGPAPTPADPSMSGPVPGPATGTMPTPQPSSGSTMPGPTPSPDGSGNGAQLPTPGTSTPFPMTPNSGQGAPPTPTTTPGATPPAPSK